MAYGLRWKAEIVWIGDGAGQMSVPGAQVLEMDTQFGNNGGIIQVPGGDAPSSANITTACTSAGTAMSTAFTAAAALARIQGFATGNP